MSDSSQLSYPIDQAGARCGWTRTRTFQLVADGLLTTYKIGKRRFVTEAALRECIRRLEEATQAGELPRPAESPKRKPRKPRNEPASAR